MANRGRCLTINGNMDRHMLLAQWTCIVIFRLLTIICILDLGHYNPLNHDNREKG